MDLTQTVTISSDVTSQEISGETVLLDMASENYFGLDEVGTRIWQLLREKKELQAVFDTLLNEYDVDEDRLEKDLAELLNKLTESGLIQVHRNEA